MEQKRAKTDSKQAESSIANSHQLTSSQLHEIFTTYFLGQKPTFERGYIAEFSILSVLWPIVWGTFNCKFAQLNIIQASWDFYHLIFRSKANFWEGIHCWNLNMKWAMSDSKQNLQMQIRTP